MDPNHPSMAKFKEKMDDYHNKKMVMLDAHHKKTMACLGQTKANTKKIDAVRRGATGCPQ
jgi:hypothetical protein